MESQKVSFTYVCNHFTESLMSADYPTLKTDYDFRKRPGKEQNSKGQAASANVNTAKRPETTREPGQSMQYDLLTYKTRVEAEHHQAGGLQKF